MTETGKDRLAARDCRWCQENGFDRELRTEAIWTNRAQADRLSNISAFGLLPMGSALTLWAVNQGWNASLAEDSLLVLESLIYSSDINQFTKLAVGRERPFVHALPETERAMADKASDHNLSFYSGHTNMVFSLATSTSLILARHGQSAFYGYGLYSMALATGYWRMAADKHWASDVILGAAVGSLFAQLWAHKNAQISLTFLPDRIQLDCAI